MSLSRLRFWGLGEEGEEGMEPPATLSRRLADEDDGSWVDERLEHSADCDRDDGKGCT